MWIDVSHRAEWSERWLNTFKYFLVEYTNTCFGKLRCGGLSNVHCLKGVFVKYFGFCFQFWNLLNFGGNVQKCCDTMFSSWVFAFACIYFVLLLVFVLAFVFGAACRWLFGGLVSVRCLPNSTQPASNCEHSPRFPLPWPSNRPPPWPWSSPPVDNHDHDHLHPSTWLIRAEGGRGGLSGTEGGERSGVGPRIIYMAYMPI